MYRIHEIRLEIGEDKGSIPDKIKKKLRTEHEITEYRIIRESIDARDKADIKYVYSVDFDIEGVHLDLPEARDEEYEYPAPGTERMNGRPVIVGFGPCGMFAALILSRLGYAPLVIERGKPVEERAKDVARLWNEGVLDEESNVQFGEGGAGTFSDGKLTTGIKDVRVRKVFEELALAGADGDILYKQKPHIGTDALRKIVKNIREKILDNGGEILFGSRLDGIAAEGGRLTGVKVRSGGAVNTIDTEILILATGHSARDTVRMLRGAGLEMERKQFSIGVRIEHPQKLINEAQYGKGADAKLPPAEYKLAYRCGDGRGAYTFCMCPGGEVIVASSQKGCLVTNGMSNKARDGKRANSALLVDVLPDDFGSGGPLAGISFQEKYERLAYELAGGKYIAPRCGLSEFLCGAEAASPVIGSLPEFAVSGIREAMPFFARKLKNFNSPEAVVYAVESRSSSPVRIVRDDGYQGSIAGIYPGGEGAGYAGGIVSAAVDGIKIAEAIIKKFQNGGDKC